MASELKDALRSASELELTVTGRKSGREISNPVWFVQEDEKLYLLPVGGADSDWYRNVLETPTIRLGASGLEASADARPITYTAIVNDIVDKFRAKYGSNVDRYYPRHDVAVEVPVA